MDDLTQVDRICEEAAARYPADIAKAVDLAANLLRGLSDFDLIVALLIRHALQERIYDVRHRANVVMRRQAGSYGGPAKVVVSNSTAIREIARSVYDYYVAGRTLGSLLGEELEPIALDEESKAAGHDFNARLLRALRPLVKDGLAVRRAICKKRLATIFWQIRNGGPLEAAGD